MRAQGIADLNRPAVKVQVRFAGPGFRPRFRGAGFSSSSPGFGVLFGLGGLPVAIGPRSVSSTRSIGNARALPLRSTSATTAALFVPRLVLRGSLFPGRGLPPT